MVVGTEWVGLEDEGIAEGVGENVGEDVERGTGERVMVASEVSATAAVTAPMIASAARKKTFFMTAPRRSRPCVG